MKRSDLIKNLRAYNKWRRGDEAVKMPEPADIGRWIDQACDELRFLDAVLDGGVAREAGRCELSDADAAEAQARAEDALLIMENLLKRTKSNQGLLNPADAARGNHVVPAGWAKHPEDVLAFVKEGAK
jgi:hypothetical protein